jgi:hypothetical protein
MYEKVKVISKKDKDLKVEQIRGFKYAKDLNQSIITIDEFFKACRSFPIVFSQNQQNEYIATVILGFTQKNVFIDGKNEWRKGEYIPAFVRRYPFIFIKENDILALAYDEECKKINTKKGTSLFEEDGSESEYVKNIMLFMQNYQISYNNTSKFIAELEKFDLLEEATAEVNVEDKKYNFKGFKKVNENKLNNLEEEKVLRLIKSGSYKLILAHLVSLGNFEKISLLQR